MQVGLIGAGNMARALARGWGEPVLCSDSGSGRAKRLAREVGGKALRSNRAVAEQSDLVVLCHKPAQFLSVSRELRGHVKAVASVLSGVATTTLREGYAVPGFRFMPNTPVEVRQGVVVLLARARARRAARGVPCSSCSDGWGPVIHVPEPLMDAAGAVVGVGPAYQALLAEAQVDAAVPHGLAAGLAGRLVADRVAGTAALLHKREYDTLAVRREVTSPGGTTARGLAALERAGVRPAFQNAFDAVVGAGR